MQKLKQILTALALFAGLPLKADGTSIVLKAIDTASPRVNLDGVDINNDNRLRAYSSGDVIVDGWMKFDLSAVPDAVVITGAELRLFAEGSFQAPQGNPVISIYYSGFDAWSRGGTGFPSSYSGVLAGPDYGPFPSVSQAPDDYTLSSAVVPWAEELLQGTISLVVRQENTILDSYMYWYGSGGTTDQGNAGLDTAGVFAPRLTLFYQPVPEPSAALLGLTAAGTLLQRRRRAARPSPLEWRRANTPAFAQPEGAQGAGSWPRE